MKNDIYERYKKLKESLEKLAVHQNDGELRQMVSRYERLYKISRINLVSRGIMFNVDGVMFYISHLLHQREEIEALLEQGASDITFYNTLDKHSLFLLLIAGLFLAKGIRDFLDLNWYEKDLERTKKKIL